jgi:hypothetical protein
MSQIGVVDTNAKRAFHLAVALELVSVLKAKAASKDRKHREAAKQKNGVPASPPLIASAFFKPWWHRAKCCIRQKRAETYA